MTKSPSLVFFGSGPVAAATLSALLDAGLVFEAVITKPRAPGHRGSVPVLELMRSHDIPVFTPTTKAELSELFATHQFSSQLGLVVDYGIIISREVIDAFELGIVNSHFSLLPQWRGADPITFSILSGQRETGVCLMLINEKLDEGLLLAEEALPLPADITTPELTDKLVALSNKMILHYLPKYQAGELSPYPQKHPEQATYSRKLTKADSIIGLNKPADQLEREVRAFRGWPKSKTTLFNQPVIITKARVAKSTSDGALVLTCSKDSYLEILELVAPSGKTMSGSDFMRGYKR